MALLRWLNVCILLIHLGISSANNTSDTQKVEDDAQRQIEYLKEEEHREAKRFVAQKTWAGEDPEALRRVLAEHNETLQRIETRRAEVERRYEKARAELRNSGAAVAFMLAGQSSDSNSDAQISHLEDDHKRQMAHLSEDKQREAKRFVDEKAWAGNDTEAQKRVMAQHNETLDRLSKATSEEQRRYQAARLRLLRANASTSATLLVEGDGQDQPQNNSKALEKLRHDHEQQIAHIQDEEQREAERYKEELHWAGSNVEDQKGVNASHNETLRRLEKVRSEEDQRYRKAQARLDNASELLVSSPQMLIGGVEGNSSQSALQHLDEAHQKQVAHLQDDESREAKRFSEEKAWAGNDTQAQERVAATHNETLHRLARARTEEKRRYEKARAQLQAQAGNTNTFILSVGFQSLTMGLIFTASAAFGAIAVFSLRVKRTIRSPPLLG